jgi:hypothetical protein
MSIKTCSSCNNETTKLPNDIIDLKNINLPCIIDIIKQRLTNNNDTNNKNSICYSNYIFIGDKILISIKILMPNQKYVKYLNKISNSKILK